MGRNSRPLEDPGSRKFVEELYRSYSRLMLSVAKRYTSNPQDQEDIVQSAMERLIGRLPDLGKLKPDSIASYVIYTTRSTAVDLGRAQARIRDHFVSMEDGAVEQQGVFAPVTPLEDDLLYREQLERLREVWGELPEEEQLLLEGRYVWELSDQELAVNFRCKPDSVRMKLTRARRSVLQRLTERGGV